MALARIHPAEMPPPGNGRPHARKCNVAMWGHVMLLLLLAAPLGYTSFRLHGAWVDRTEPSGTPITCLVSNHSTNNLCCPNSGYCCQNPRFDAPPESQGCGHVTEAYQCARPDVSFRGSFGCTDLLASAATQECYADIKLWFVLTVLLCIAILASCLSTWVFTRSH